MDDLELEKLFELFDKALTSKDERVVNALRSLLMIAALTNTEEDGRTVGPLTQMMNRLRTLENRMSSVEISQRGGYTGGAGMGVWPGTVGYPQTGSGPIWNGPYSSTSLDITSSGAVSGGLSPTAYSLSISDEEIDELLKGIK